MSDFRIIRTMAVVVFLACLATPGLNNLACGQNSEARGREALKNMGKLPWYDSQSDTFRQVETDTRMGDRRAVSKNRGQLEGQFEEFKNPKAPSPQLPAGASTQTGWLQFIGWTVLVLFVAMLIAFLVWAFLRADSDRREVTLEEEARIRSDIERIDQLPFNIDLPSSDWLSAARHAYEKSDYRRAIMYLFSHVLLSLDRKGFIQLARGKTNRQYLGELQASPDLAKYLGSVLIPFEQSFFGDYDLQQQQVGHCIGELSEFENRLNRTTVIN